jgi:hypothetical protein
MTGQTLEGEGEIRYHSNPYKLEFFPNMADNFKPGFDPYKVSVSCLLILSCFIKGKLLLHFVNMYLFCLYYRHSNNDSFNNNNFANDIMQDKNIFLQLYIEIRNIVKK